MSPRGGNAAVRAALIEAAATLLAESGPRAVTTRRVASQVGTSTMAVYTHFSGIEALLRAVREEGFIRLAAHLAAVRRTRDPVADLTASGSAYVSNGLQNPHLYRAMFLTRQVNEGDTEVGADVFATLVGFVQRCLDAGRFPYVADAQSGAYQCWMLTHASVASLLAGILDPTTTATVLTALAETCYVGFGDDRAAARASIKSGMRRQPVVAER